MAKQQRGEDGIDTGSNLAFESRFWIFQRIAWTLLLCLVVTGLLGGFGRGIFSSAALTFSGGGHIEYEKLLRFKTPTSYTLNIKRPVDFATASPDVRINLSQELLSKLILKINESTPSASAVEAYAGGLVLVFKPAPSAEALQIKLTFEPKAIGTVQGVLGLAGSEPVQIHQFVYP